METMMVYFGITPSSPKEKLRDAYLQFVLLYHPDKQGDTQLFTHLHPFWQGLKKGSEMKKGGGGRRW
jgi:hypothetical protein